MTKTYSPEEVAKEVLKRCQRLVEEYKLKKAEHKDEKEDKELCEEAAEKEVDEHEDEMHDKKKVKKGGKLAAFMSKRQKGINEEVSSAVDQGASLKGNIARAHKEAKKVGHYSKEKELKDTAKRISATVRGEMKEIKPNLPKSEVVKCGTVEKCGDIKEVKKTKKAETSKAIGLQPPKDPMGVTEKVKEPSASDMKAPKPKAATTLKDFMAKRKK